jgi:hypothetical protein
MKKLGIFLLACFALVVGYAILDHYMSPTAAEQVENSIRIDKAIMFYTLECEAEVSLFDKYDKCKRVDALTPAAVEEMSGLFRDNIRLLKEGGESLTSLKPDSWFWESRFADIKGKIDEINLNREKMLRCLAKEPIMKEFLDKGGVPKITPSKRMEIS